MLFRKPLFYGFYIHGAENLFCTYPLMHIFANAIKIGSLPLWTSKFYFGYPIYTESCASVFHPLQWFLYSIFSLHKALTLSVIFDFLLISIFTFYFAREIGLDVKSSIVTSLSFTFCGISLGLLWGVMVLHAVPFIPIGVFLLERFFKRRKIAYLIALSICIAISFSSGFPQISLYNLTFLIGYIVWKTFRIRELDLLSKSKLLLLVIGSCILGAVAAAPALLPTYELIKFTERANGVSYTFASSGSFKPLQLITLVIPGLILGKYGVLGVYANPYIGIIPLLAALTAVFYRKKTDATFWLVAIGGVFLYAVGKYNPLYFFFHKLPPFSFFRAPYRSLIIFEFCLAILAGKGFALWQSANSERKRDFMRKGGIAFAILGAVLLAASAILSYNLHSILNSFQIEVYFIVIAALTLLISGLALALLAGKKMLGWVLVALVFLDLITFSVTTRAFTSVSPSQYSAPNSAISTLKKDHSLFRIYTVASPVPKKYQGLRFTPWEGYGQDLSKSLFSTNILYNVPSWVGPVSLQPQRGLALTSIIEGKNNSGHTLDNGTLTRVNRNAEFLGYLNIKYILTYGRLSSPEFKLIKDSRPRIYLNTKVKPRAFLTKSIKVIKGDHKAFAEIERYGLRANPVIIDRQITQKLDYSQGNVRITRYGEQEVGLAARLNGFGLLVLNDTFYPGWKATVNGKPVRIYHANYNFRAILLPPGAHKVTFSFQPPILKASYLISAIALSIIVMAALLFKKPLSRMGLVNKTASRRGNFVI